MKKLTITCILVLSLFLNACSNSELKITDAGENDSKEIIYDPPIIIPDNPVLNNGVKITEVVGFKGSELLYGTLKALQEEADLVVIGEFIEESDDGFEYMYDSHFEKDIIIYGKAFNKLRIIEVLEGDIEIGEKITVLQYYAFDDEQGKLMTYDRMTPMHKGDRWIYFLVYNEYAEAYESVGGVDGRFPIPDRYTMQAMEEFIDEFYRIREWASDKIVMTVPEAKEKGIGIGEPRANGSYYTACLKNEVVYYFTAEESLEHNNMWTESRTIVDKIETSVFGVLDRYEFGPVVYLSIIEEYNLQAQDWVNPGRSFDAGLIAIVEEQLKPLEGHDAEEVGDY